MVFGYDTFNDKRFANNHQSGSDYRILGTTTIIRGRARRHLPAVPRHGIDDHPVQPDPDRAAGHELPDALAVLQRQLAREQPAHRRTWACAGTRTTATNSAGKLVANDSAFSPRLGVVWDPTGDGGWSVTASFAKYVAALNNSDRRLRRRRRATRRRCSGLYRRPDHQRRRDAPTATLMPTGKVDSAGVRLVQPNGGLCQPHAARGIRRARRLAQDSRTA